jgi:hypothetical protein
VVVVVVEFFAQGFDRVVVVFAFALVFVVVLGRRKSGDLGMLLADLS